MKVEIWSDVVCPWCYIGKRRFEAALAEFPHRDSVEVEWKAFELDPTSESAPAGTVVGPRDQATRLAEKYGTDVAGAQRMVDNVVTQAAADGLDYRLDRERVASVLEGSEYADGVQTDLAQARAFGISGVPFFVVDRKYGVSGAQPTDVFTAMLEQAWADEHPRLQLMADGTVCGPDGCPIGGPVPAAG